MREIKDILKKLMSGELDIETATKFLKAEFIENVGDLAQLDIFRKVRTGIPEVIYAERKNNKLLIEIINKFLENNQFAVVSRCSESQKDLIIGTFSPRSDLEIDVNELGKILLIKEKSYKLPQKGGKVGLITAGSSDIPVAEEAYIILKVMGCQIFKSYDVGIAGIHRIFKPLSKMIHENVHVIIVCAGMEGTLPGVVAALVDVPVIGVPVSSGYGLGEKGKGALTTMLQSCSPGLLIVNIDNGFGAGASAALIANKMAE
ncbi:MAG: nickel pincer cofactor biosynthesis protein LarB [Promethearchaeia archaeon]